MSKTLVPPNDIVAERAVLSAAMLDATARDTVLSTLDDESYYQPNHRLFHRAMRELTEGGSPVDIVTMMAWARDRDLVQRCGGASYLGDMVDETPAIANVKAHTDIVRHKAKLRKAIEVCQKFARDGYGHRGDASTYLAELEQAVFALSSDTVKGEPQPLQDVLTAGFTELRTAAGRGDQVAGLHTGLEDFDKALSGLHDGDLIIVAGRPGMGKSALVLNMVLAATDTYEGRERIGGALFSLEMPSKQLGFRAVCSDAGVELTKTRSLAFETEDWNELTASAATLARLPVLLDDTPGIGLHDLRAKARRCDSMLRQRFNVPLGLIAVDYLQLMTGPGQNRENEISTISRGLKQVAKEFNVPVVALAQLNRKCEEQKNKRPMVSHLRDSGAIEQDADVIIFIYRDDFYDAESRDKGIAELIIAKQRNGPTGAVRVGWHGPTTKFRDLTFAERQEHADRQQFEAAS